MRRERAAARLAFSPARAIGEKGHGYVARALIWRGLGQGLGRLVVVEHSALGKAAVSRRLPLRHLGANRILFLPAKTESRRSRGASRSLSLAQGAGGDREGGGTPEVLSPLDGHRAAHSQRREPSGWHRAGEGPHRNRGKTTGAGRGNGGRTTTGDPASVQGRPLLLPVRSALPPASLPRLPRGAAALHKHGSARGAGALCLQPDGEARPAAGRGAAAGRAAAARLRRQTGREARAGSSGGLRAPPRVAALP